MPARWGAPDGRPHLSTATDNRNLCATFTATPRRLEPAGHHDWTEYTPSQEIYEAWLALPLIVLAGLR